MTWFMYMWWALKRGRTALAQKPVFFLITAAVLTLKKPQTFNPLKPQVGKTEDFLIKYSVSESGMASSFPTQFLILKSGIKVLNTNVT